jgi:hypothetical protein
MVDSKEPGLQRNNGSTWHLDRHKKLGDFTTLRVDQVSTPEKRQQAAALQRKSGYPSTPPSFL